MTPDDDLTPAGRVLGTEDATPLEFWVAVRKDAYLQLDEWSHWSVCFPAAKSSASTGWSRRCGPGTRARASIATSSSSRAACSPQTSSEAAQVLATRFEPEMFVPPLPGAERATRRTGPSATRRCYFADELGSALPIGLSRDDEPVYRNLDFLDGTAART